MNKCLTCEAPVSDDLADCITCQLIAFSVDDHTHDNDASHPFPGLGWPLSTDDPVDTPF